MKTIAITIDDETLQRLERARQGRGSTNRSKLVREAVKDYLARLEATADDEREALVLRRRRARLARQAEAAVKAQARS
ncbi:MAG TPA: ribbon-helix-helix protein, CopG family [Vicinamibacterales bacterium]|nr:ribbon-helix-helix protein, CopG family [Vicinamibacterales bacterium]